MVYIKVSSFPNRRLDLKRQAFPTILKYGKCVKFIIKVKVNNTLWNTYYMSHTILVDRRNSGLDSKSLSLETCILFHFKLY